MPASFDRIARAYRWLEYLSFGPVLERCRLDRLRQLENRQSALVIGDGDGRFLARLVAANPRLRAEAVDASPAMLRLLARRAAAAGAAGRLTLRCEDARGFTPSGPYDLVVTHFFLDCLETGEILALGRRIRPHLSPGALWIVSEFAIPAGMAALPARLIVSALYLAFGLLAGLEARKLPDHGEALREAGFTRSERKEWLRGLLFSEVWTLRD